MVFQRFTTYPENKNKPDRFLTKKSLLGLFIAFKVLSTSRLNFCTYKIEITNVILGFSYSQFKSVNLKKENPISFLFLFF